MTPLKKETENTSKWKNLPFSCHSKIDIAKMVILPKMTLFNTIIIKISITFLTKLEKTILKSIWRHRRLPAVKTILSKNNQMRVFWILSYPTKQEEQKQYPIGIKTDTGQRAGIEAPEPNPHSERHNLIFFFTEMPKNRHWWKDNDFNIQCWANWTYTYRRTKIDSHFSSWIKTNSKWSYLL